MKYYEDDETNTAYEMDEDEMKDIQAEASLWENIRKKKQRMGENYKPAKPGDKDYPSKDALERAKGAPDINKHYFKTEEEALQDARRLGLKGIHMHKTDDGKVLYMAGPNHQAFMKRHKEIQKEAEAYFDEHGRGKGSGYKQFKIWEYQALRNADDNGVVISENKTLKEVHKFHSNINNRSSASAN